MGSQAAEFLYAALLAYAKCRVYVTLQLETPGLWIKPGELEPSSCLLQAGAC